MNKKISMSLVTVTYNRPHLLKEIALPSIIQQAEKNFEWIIVNDARNQETKKIIDNLTVDFPIIYLEIDHIETGFSLCAGKNLAIQSANTDIIGYIDDDNRLYPNYTKEIVKAFKENNCSFLMSQQNRWKHVYENEKLIRKEGPQLSPISGCSLKDLVIPNKSSYFDSNGFAHIKSNAPIWDIEYRVFCDYTYLLNSIRSWGVGSFHFLEKDLVDYIQTSKGVVGSSTYAEWAEEFKRIWSSPTLKSSCDLFDGESWFPNFIKHFDKKAQEVNKIEGFQA
jgi:glycosyltransferase involved in cell wall biosynthesis